MEDWADITSSESESSNDELESELYSVLHYNSFSGDVPVDLLEKYNIQRNDKNEFFISIKSISNSYDVTAEDVKLEDNSETVPSTILEEHTSPILSEPEKKDIECSTSFDEVPSNKVVSGNETDEVILISDDSDENDDSDVVIQENDIEVAVISSSSSMECLSDPDLIKDMILNTSHRASVIFPPCDVEEEEFKYNWKDVASPSTWSEPMKKYYNRPCKRLKYFDCKKILEEIKGKGTWDINPADMVHPRKGPSKRCTFCRSPDHLVKNCPKRFSNCSMCGDAGHGANMCPNSMCFNCGQPNGIFVPLCRKCEHERYKTCGECNQVGHVKANCPDNWRRYHLTTSGTLNEKSLALNEKLMCCNCGKQGHLYENCKQLYWSAYPPSTVLVKNYKELHFVTGQMKNIHRTRPDVPSPKRPRWSERKSNSTRYFNNSIDYSGQSQSTPVHVNRNANASGSFNHNGISPSKFDGVSNTPGHYKKKFKRLNKDLKKKRHSTSPCNFNNNYKSPSSEKKKKKRHKNSPNFKNKNKSRRVDDINNTI